MKILTHIQEDQVGLHFILPLYAALTFKHPNYGEVLFFTMNFLFLSKVLCTLILSWHSFVSYLLCTICEHARRGSCLLFDIYMGSPLEAIY